MNIKLIIIFFTIILLFVYLYLSKQEKKNKIPYINKLKSVIENFTEECENSNTKIILDLDLKKIEKFRKSFFFDIYPDLDNFTFENLKFNNYNNSLDDENNFRYYLSKEIKRSNREPLIDKDKIVFGPSGLVFDTRRDDIIVFDISKLRRFQVRMDRTLTDNLPNFKLTIKEVYSQEEIDRFLLFQMINAILDNKNVFQNELLTDLVKKKNLDEDKIQIPFIIEKNETNNLKDENIRVQKYFKECIEKLENLDKVGISVVKGLGERIDNENNKEVYIDEEFYNDKDKLINDLTEYKNSYDKFYYKKMICISEPEAEHCKIRYQNDVPLYDMGKQGKGIHKINFDFNDTTLQHPYILDDRMNPNNNSWLSQRHKGYFSPHISYINKSNILEGTNKDLYSGENIQGEVTGNIVNENNEGSSLEKAFKSFNSGYPIIRKKDGDKFSIFNLPDEYDMTGIGMCMNYESNNSLIFVPDIINNRIQVFECNDNNFIYKGEFGNLPFTNSRSLPTYQGEGNNDDEFLLGATTNYEPIVNTESSTTTAGYKCNLSGCGTGVGNCLSRYLENGPFDYELEYGQNIRTGKRLDEVGDNLGMTNKFYNPKNRNKSEDIMECKNQFSKRRANIHGKQTLGNDGSEEKVYAGHFYHLLSEYYSVLSFEAKKSLNYYNPHLIGLKFQITNSRGNKTETIDDGVTGASVAYRKFLLKVIKATDDGQAFGQLLRPKSIAYDDEDRKYYVVDTYHHCIQCYQENIDDDGSLGNTVGGQNIPFECVDRKEGYDNNLEHYLYDETFDEPTGKRIKKYNRSKMYSLGVRQKVLHDRSNSIYNDRKAQPYLNEDWGVKYCQSIDNQAVVKLFRWVSGNTVFTGDDYENIESPALYTELCKKDDIPEIEEKIKNQIKYSCPGTGEFLYPTDIVITENPFKNEKLMMVTDMGNNRVSIFKKYNIGGEKRFRFFRFLGESENIINPISITVSVTGKVFVLQGNFMDTDGQKILIFYPAKDDDKNNSSKLKYTKSNKQIILKKGDTLKNVRAVKIRIDDRGMIAVCDANNNSIHIVGEVLQDTEKLIKFEKEDMEITGSTFNIKPTVDYYLNNEFDKDLDNLPNFNRFRFVLIRKNLSTYNSDNKDELELFMSREYYKNPKELKLYNNNKSFDNRETKYIIEDKYTDNLFENYWSNLKYFKNNNISTDLVDYDNKKIITSNRIDFDYKKDIGKLNIFDHSNTVLDGVYDWNGKSLQPNCSYKYIYGFYNNLDLVDITNQSGQSEITTFPLHISKEDIVRRNIVSRNKNCLEFKINYGNISPIHRKTMRYNPLSLRVLRTSHNRSKDVNNKYLNCIKGEMIQIIVPSESKSFYNLQSKPKYGKLYYYNVYKPGNVRMQNTLMKERVLYDNSKYLLFYSSEGGSIGDGGVSNVPSSEQIGNDFIDDFFILGDTPETIYKQVKFRVRIKVSRTSDKIIILDKPNELRNKLNNYSKNPGEMDQYSTRLIQQIPLYEEDNDGNYEYPDVKKYYDKGTFNFRIEPNRTYEYTVMVSNHKVLNPACSTFFVTTRPEKPYIYKKGAEFVELDYNGQKRKYLKIVWFCPKDEGIYWPYNFFIIRKQIKKKQIQKPEVVRVELHIDGNPKFIKSGKSIIINPSIKNEDIPEEGLEFLFNQDLGSLKDWKVTFQSFKNKSGSQSENKKIIINDEEFEWQDLKRSYEFNGRSLTFSLKLKKDEYLQNVKIEETVILPSASEISSLKSEIDTEYKQKDNQQKKELKKKFENYKVQDELEERQKLIALYEEYRKNQKLGFAFTLQDDYQGDIETSKEFYKGYSGDLYNYLKVLNKEQLLKIFDELNDKIAKNFGDVTMRLDGPSGMLRSGGIDMLIDKIRYLSYKLRENQKERNKIIPFGRKCQEVSIKDLMSDASLKTSKTCIDKEYELRKKEKDKEKEKQEKFLTEKLENEKNNKKLELDKEKQRLNRLKLQLKEENNKIKKENEEILGKIESKEEQIKKLLEEEKLTEKKLKQQLEKAESEMGDKTKLREAFLLDTVTLPEQKVLTDITKKFMIMNKNLKLGSIERGYNYLGEFVLIPYDEREVLDVKETFEVLKDEGKTKLDINWDKPEDLLEVLLDSIKFGLNDPEFKQSYDEVKFMTLDFATNTVKFIKEVEYSESDSNIVPDPNIVILTKQAPEKSKKEIEEAEVNNTNLIDELRKQIEELKNSLKSGKILTESGDRTIKLTDKQIENDVDVLRLEDQVLQLQNIVDKKETDMSLCEWSFVKSKEGDSKFKSEFSFSQPINRETKDKILQEYAISPDLVSLGNKKNFIRGEDIFDNPSLSKEDKEKEYIGYKQLIEVGRNSKGYKFDYKVGIFQTGYSFRNKAIRNYLGVDLTTNDYLDEKLPILNLGENYSDTFSAGDIIVNEKQEVIPDKEPVLPIKSLPQEEDKPRILFFEPKEGYQNTVVKIVGTKLDELDYICFRDIKVKVLRKGKRVLKNMIDFDFRNSNDKDSDFITNNNIIKLKEDKEQSILNKTIDLGKNYKFYRLNINYKLLEEQEKTIKIKYNILNTEGKEEIIEHEHLWTPENTFFDFKLEDGTKNKINRIELTIDSVNQGEEFGPIQINELREDSDKVDDMLIYDEYLVKPPTLKELNKECWQSLERYKVLVWGFYKKLGLQIRSSEGKISEGKSQDKLLTYTYMDRIECPENERLQMPNKS